MDSGIYKITFSNQQYYIGKSENMPQRWKTHQKNFEQNTHTKKMQAVYNQYGQPEYSVLLPVHSDHIDIYESILISAHWGPQLLNTTKPKSINPADAQKYLEVYDKLMFNNISCMLHSTLDHCTAIQETFEKLQQADIRLEQLESSGIVLETEVAQEIFDLKQLVEQQHTELKRLKQLGWWDRLFNYTVYE